MRHQVPSITTVQGLEAAVQGIDAVREGRLEVRPLQDWGRAIRAARESADAQIAAADAAEWA